MARRLEEYAEDREKWERQKWETHKAYDAFWLYARYPYDSEPDDTGRRPGRSIAKVARRLGKHVKLLERWSRRWKWVERSEAYDVEQSRIERQALDAERKKAITRRERREIQARDRAWRLFGEVEEKVREMLAFPLYDETIEEDEGNRIVVIREPKDDWNWNTVSNLILALRRLADVSLDTDRGALDRLLDDLDLDLLSDDQLDKIIEGADPLEVILEGYRFGGTRKGGEKEEGEVDVDA